MGSFWSFLFGLILMVIWIVAGVYITQTNIILRPIHGDDPDLTSANDYAFWAAFVTWFLVSAFILLAILSVFGVVELFGAFEAVSASSKGISIFTLLFLGFAFALVTVTGVLSVISAVDIAKSPIYSNNPSADLQRARTDAIIAACLCIGAAGVLIIGGIIYLIVGYRKQRKINELKAENLKNIRQTKVEAAQARERRLQSFQERYEEARIEAARQPQFYPQGPYQQSYQQPYQLPYQQSYQGFSSRIPEQYLQNPVINQIPQQFATNYIQTRSLGQSLNQLPGQIMSNYQQGM